MKIIKYLIGIALIVGISILNSYLFQIILFGIDPKTTAVSAVVLMLVGCGAVTVLIYIIAVLLSRHFKWFAAGEGCIVILISTIIFVIFMILFFPHLEVPYSLIPAREGAVAYGGLLIQIFTVIPAAVIGMISLGLMIVKRKGR